MLFEFLRRCFFIKILLKGELKNLTENTEDLINTNGIKNFNTISFIHNKTKYKIIINENKITLLRENDELSHSMIFEENKKHKSEYYIKEYSSLLEFTIQTIKMIIDKNKIDITYKIIESDIICNYILEMSDNL